MTETIPIIRDARVDQIGFCGELEKSAFLKDLKSAVKLRLSERDVARATGDYFEGLLIESNTSTTDPDKLLRLYERGKITRAQLVSALKVTREPCKEFLSLDDLAKISTAEPAAPRLTVVRKKGVQLELVDAVKSLAAALGEPRVKSKE